ncbi:MAG: 6,7-dimethyl-8-ribityllumazine synthase [Pelagibacterales bacterium]|nr:6,7-dimethyl-8-ribityllumazine synthase [Pelagibacterales bacterium]
MLSQDSNNINVKITNPEKLKITLVVSEWHSEITNKLFYGAKNLLIKNGLLEENIKRLDVPGSFELIYGSRMAQNNNQHAVIAIGCVIKGETPHFDFICSAVSTGIKDLNILYKTPVIFCVLTDNNIEQSLERSGGKHGNKGEDSALAALKLISTLDK